MYYVKKSDEFISGGRINEMAVRPDVFKGYDEVDIFDSTYFIVKNGDGLYNLIDRNGNLISDVWFDKITKNDDGSVETVMNDGGNKGHAATYSDTREFEDCVEVQKDLLDGIGLSVDIDFDDIVLVTPYTIKTDTKNTVTVIAKVMLGEKECLLGKDGKLYNADGSAYVERNGAVSGNIVEYLKNELHLVYDKNTRLWNCNGDVKVTPMIVREDRKGFTIDFGVVRGNFDCYNSKLISLEGAPREVGGNFECGYNQLTSLEGAPRKVGRDFACESNHLTTLEGCPQSIGGDFYCSNNNLTTLEGAPQSVGGDFDCSHNDLICDEAHLYGFLPKVIGGKLKAGRKCNYRRAQTYYRKR